MKGRSIDMEKEDIRHDVKSFIDIMDLDELVKLNSYIYKRIKFLAETKVMEKVQDFEILDKVSFFDGRGNIVKGTIVRLNKRSVTVKSENGTEWRVSPFLLNKSV